MKKNIFLILMIFFISTTKSVQSVDSDQEKLIKSILASFDEFKNESYQNEITIYKNNLLKNFFNNEEDQINQKFFSILLHELFGHGYLYSILQLKGIDIVNNIIKLRDYN